MEQEYIGAVEQAHIAVVEQAHIEVVVLVRKYIELVFARLLAQLEVVAQ